MHRFLLDTQVLLWLLVDRQKLSTNVERILLDPLNQIFASQISLFEIVIKQTIGKLPHFTANSVSIVQQLQADGFLWLPLLDEHLAVYPNIPLFSDHRDPFDRLLLATAHSENMTLLSADAKFQYYTSHVQVVW